MRYHYLGSTGLQVSELCLGTMTFGRESDPATSRAVFERAVEAGINFFDCANMYAGGDSEKLLGEFAKPHRDSYILTSKCGFAAGDADRNQRGLSRRHILESVEASLRRLQTDYLDVFFTHFFDPRTPMEEVLRTMDDLITQGKIRYFGVSNWSAWQTAKALGISHARGWNRIACIEPMYNLVKRQAEVEILPLATEEKLGVISYSPLGGGLLTGKHRYEERPEGSRLAHHEMYQKRYGSEWMYATANALRDLAEDRGENCVTLAIAWAARHPAVTAPIIGARNLEQLEPVLAAAEFTMPDDLYQQITALSYQPPPATDRSEDQA